MDPSKQLSGMWISFTDEEYRTIMEALEALGYPPDVSGCKQFLLESITEQSCDGEDYAQPGPTISQRLGSMLVQYLEQNPELASQARAAADTLAARILSRIKQKRGQH